jgi:protein-S-isoprenylcysteine O-methyltransferase Ste14
MVVKLLVQTFTWFGAMALLLFLSAGTLHWPGAWAYLAEMIVLGSWSGLLLVRHDPALVKERLGPLVQKQQPTADKVFIVVLLPLMVAWLVVMGLDAVRFAWSSVPVWAQVLGAFSLGFSTWLTYRTFRANSFAAAVVKIQPERAQTVISTGPYAYVRHPMYFGMLFFFLGTPLLLGSWWGVVGALVLILLLCIRIPIEEKTLRAGLAGYDDYMTRVRYRLIPLVW